PRLFAQQIGSIFARAFLRLLFSPRCDFAVISAQQDFRNFPAAEFRRACVLWPLQQTFAKTVLVGGLFVAKNTGDQSHNRINENYRSDCTVRQHIIADGYFLIDQMFNYSMVNAFVMATDDNEMRFL